MNSYGLEVKFPNFIYDFSILKHIFVHSQTSLLFVISFKFFLHFTFLLSQYRNFPHKLLLAITNYSKYFFYRPQVQQTPIKVEFNSNSAANFKLAHLSHFHISKSINEIDKFAANFILISAIPDNTWPNWQADGKQSEKQICRQSGELATATNSGSWSGGRRFQHS